MEYFSSIKTKAVKGMSLGVEGFERSEKKRFQKKSRLV